jgi:hypothetical protein
MKQSPDYFVETPSVEDAVLRRIKGSFRQNMVLKSLQTGDLASIPELWRAHDAADGTVLSYSDYPTMRL